MMKRDNEMTECLFDTPTRFDSLHLKGKQKNFWCMTKIFHHETHDSAINHILTPTQKSIKSSQKQLSNSLILPLKCAKFKLTPYLLYSFGEKLSCKSCMLRQFKI